MKNLLSEKDNREILEILAHEFDVDPSQLSMEADFFRDLGADSLSMIQISMALEEHFELSLPDEKQERIRTVGELLDLLGETLNPTR